MKMLIAAIAVSALLGVLGTGHAATGTVTKSGFQTGSLSHK